MAHPPKPFTAAEIHAVYATVPATKKDGSGENDTSKYTRSPHFKRDPNHPGRAPNKLDLAPGSRRK
jgi:hypothetical protein